MLVFVLCSLSVLSSVYPPSLVVTLWKSSSTMCTLQIRPRPAIQRPPNAATYAPKPKRPSGPISRRLNEPTFRPSVHTQTLPLPRSVCCSVHVSPSRLWIDISCSIFCSCLVLACVMFPLPKFYLCRPLSEKQHFILSLYVLHTGRVPM